MPEYTTKLNLKKPAPNEYVNIVDINDNMDKISDSIGTANGIAELDESGQVPEEQLGNANAIVAIHENGLIPHGYFASTTEFTYDGDKLTQADESISGVLRLRTTLNYTDGVLSSVREQEYANDGVTIIKDYTKSISYTGDKMSEIGRVINI